MISHLCFPEPPSPYRQRVQVILHMVRGREGRQWALRASQIPLVHPLLRQAVGRWLVRVFRRALTVYIHPVSRWRIICTRHLLVRSQTRRSYFLFRNVLLIVITEDLLGLWRRSHLRMLRMLTQQQPRLRQLPHPLPWRAIRRVRIPVAPPRDHPQAA